MDYHLSEEGNLIFDDSTAAYKRFQKDCSKQGIITASTKKFNMEMYAGDHVLPNGFVNTSLGSGHFNKYGHEAMADVLAETITELEAQ